MANITPARVADNYAELYPGGDAQATECSMNLLQVSDLLLGNVAGLIKPYDVTPASGLVLSILRDADGPLAPNQIAERLIVSRATVTGLVDSLERRKLVKRRAHPTDRRMVLVEITERGREVTDIFRPLVHRHERDWLAGLTASEKTTLLALLARVQAGLVE